jgi:hypothetical protein
MTKGRSVVPDGNGPRMSQGGAAGNQPVKTGGNDAASGNSGQNHDRGGWSKFGGRSDGSSQGVGSQNDNGRGSRNGSIPQDRGTGQYSPRGNDNRDRYDRSSYKPPLEMNKPVVTPRDDRRNSGPSYSGPSYQDSRHNSYTPPPPPRSEVHSMPPSRSSGGSYGGYSGGSYSGGRGSSGGSSHSYSSSGSSSHSSSSSGGSHGSSGGSHSSSSSKDSGSKHR